MHMHYIVDQIFTVWDWANGVRPRKYFASALLNFLDLFYYGTGSECLLVVSGALHLPKKRNPIVRQIENSDSEV